LAFRLEDPDSGLRTEVAYRVLEGGAVLRASARLEDAGSAPVAIEVVTSFVASGLAGPGGTPGDLDIYWGTTAGSARTGGSNALIAMPWPTSIAALMAPTPGKGSA
jgi:hypothetical protein